MAYNRWLSPDELEHHGVKGQTWGVTNGPPYPLSRQKRFRTIGPDGRPITSKVAYKKAMKVQRAANRSERRAHPNGTEEDKKERNSFGARVVRAYRTHKADAKKRAEHEEQFKKDNKLFEEALDRVEGIEGLSDKEQSELSKILAKQQHDEKRKGSTNAKELADEVNAFADRIEKGRLEDAKAHGSAEEVMKLRDKFTTDDWKEIARRLDAEAAVSKYLTNKVSESPSGSSIPSDSKLKALYLKGTAREVYERRADFTIDQLDAISKRLKAESIIGEYANKQVDVPSKAYTNFKKLSDVLSVAGNSADSISKIVKVFGGSGGSGGGGGKQKIKGPKESNDQKGQKEVTLADIAKSLKGLNDVNKSLEEIKKKLGKS